MRMTFERECGCWSQFAVISREQLAGCLEGLERLTKPLLCQLSYASPRDQLSDLLSRESERKIANPTILLLTCQDLGRVRSEREARFVQDSDGSPMQAILTFT
jgi:hypothetical protein